MKEWRNHPKLFIGGHSTLFLSGPRVNRPAFRYRFVPHRDPSMYLSRAAAPLIRGKDSEEVFVPQPGPLYTNRPMPGGVLGQGHPGNPGRRKR